jgi:hypothetical protein
LPTATPLQSGAQAAILAIHESVEDIFGPPP